MDIFPEKHSFLLLRMKCLVITLLGLLLSLLLNSYDIVIGWVWKKTSILISGISSHRHGHLINYERSRISVIPSDDVEMIRLSITSDANWSADWKQKWYTQSLLFRYKSLGSQLKKARLFINRDRQYLRETMGNKENVIGGAGVGGEMKQIKIDSTCNECTSNHFQFVF